MLTLGTTGFPSGVGSMSTTHGSAGNTLLRRVMILCPLTGRSVDTGFELATPAIGPEPQLLVDCTECGQDHEWLVEDAFLES
jgi:hypothetical protein